MSESKFTRCEDPAALNRCQGIYKDGQCPYESNEGSQYCAMHGGNQAQNKDDKIKLRNLRLTRARWTARARELADSEGIKSLRDEIAILRLMLEEKLESCRGEADLMLASPVISEWIMKIEKLVTSAHRLESNLGELLDKAAVVQLTGELVAIIGEGLDSIVEQLINDLGSEYEEKIRNAVTEEVVDKICEKITQTTVEAGRNHG